MRRALAVAALASATLANAMPARAAGPAASPAPASDAIKTLLRSQVGSWDCTITYPGLRESEKFIVVWSGFGDHHIIGTADLPAFRSEPARKASVILGYDPVAKAWTNAFADSTGAYAFAQSTAGSRAKTMTFTNVYPVDPTLRPSLVVLGPRTTTIDNSWTVSGTERASHEVCAKIPV